MATNQVAAKTGSYTILLDAPLRVTRRDMETRLVIEADGAARAPDPALIQAVARGHI